MSDDARLLREQLQAALADLGRGEAEPLEVMALAGLLDRLASDDPLLDEARGVTVSPDTLVAAADDAADDVLALDEGDDDGERWDALCALDETCAAATFAGQPEAVAASVDEAVRFVRAFPEAWRAHAEEATAVLQHQPPRSDDPARRVWAAVEASRWAVQGAAEGASRRTLEALGLPVVVSLEAFRGPVRLAAASSLPAEAPWRTLGSGQGWELALTLDDGRPVLLLAGAPTARFTREDTVVEATPTVEGLVCEAVPGRWRVEVDDRDLRFEVRP